MTRGMFDGDVCKLSITVNQTDYDNEDDTPETIEYIRVDGEGVAADLKPGQNPCKSAWKGHPVAPSDLKYLAVDSYDVTHIVKEGRKVPIAGKISAYVDE